MRPNRLESSGQKTPRVIAIASGKGGVGKTVIAFNLACQVAKNHRVLLIDGDFQTGNVHLLANINPRRSLLQECMAPSLINEAVTAVRPNLDILGAVGGDDSIGFPEIGKLAEFLGRLRQWAESYEVVIIDTATGIIPQTSLLLHAADEVVLVTTPELTAISNSYAIFKIITEHSSRVSVSLLVNQENDDENRRYIGRKFAEITDRFLSRLPGFWGGISRDSAVVESVAAQTPLLDSSPNSMVNRELSALARRIEGSPLPENKSRNGLISAAQGSI